MEDLDPPRHSSAGFVMKSCLLLFGTPVLLLAAILVYTFVFTSSHSSPESIMWPGGDRVYMPASATDIKLRRTFFDHWAIYTVPSRDLQAYLASQFSVDSEPDGEADEDDRQQFEDRFGSSVVAWPEGLVSYRCYAPNGGTHDYYHDPATGLTYQASVGW